MSLALKKMSPVIKKRFQQLLKDPYLVKKYNRDKRLNNKFRYFHHVVSDNIWKFKNKGKFVIDIGPGPGEFLEVCRFYGFKIYGIDADCGDCMGNEYYKLSKLMHFNQNISVGYKGLDGLLKDWKHIPFENNSVCLVNSQGSIEQAFKKFIIGDNFRGGRDVIEWDISKECKEMFQLFFCEVSRILVRSGILMIWANGTKNLKEYDKLIKEITEKTNKLVLIENILPSIHKIKKI